MEYKRTLTDFDKLSLFQKTCTLWIYGNIVHRMETEDSILEIYSIGNFFVEVIICRSKKKVIKMNSFSLADQKSEGQYFSGLDFGTTFNFQCN
jgi:hypothetical protein